MSQKNQLRHEQSTPRQSKGLLVIPI